MAELDTMYRVMILYMLDKAEEPLTNTQIINLILEKDYTNYFTAQQIIWGLLSSKLITAEPTRSNTRYRMTAEGQQTLRFFDDKVSSEIKEDILTYLKEHQFELKKESSVYADYFKSSDPGYQTRCLIRNREKSVLDLTLTVQTEEQAKAICANWRRESEDVYALLMDKLLK